MKGRQIVYGIGELDFIRARCTQDRRAMHADFVRIFSRPDVSLSNLNSLCKRKGWFTGRDGRIPKGNIPANKGKSMPFHPNSAKTQFKKDRLPHNFRGAGHERVDEKDGYVVMIVAETNPWTGAETRPVLKHRYLWEQANGALPDGHCLKCLDGDKTNTDPSNWEAIPRGVLPRLNGGRHKKRIAYDDAPAELKPTVMAVAKIEHQIHEKRRRPSLTPHDEQT